MTHQQELVPTPHLLQRNKHKDFHLKNVDAMDQQVRMLKQGPVLLKLQPGLLHVKRVPQINSLLVLCPMQHLLKHVKATSLLHAEVLQCQIAQHPQVLNHLRRTVPNLPLHPQEETFYLHPEGSHQHKKVLNKNVPTPPISDKQALSCTQFVTESTKNEENILLCKSIKQNTKKHKNLQVY